MLLQCDMTAAAITLDLTTRDIRVYALHLMEEAGAPPRQIQIAAGHKA